MSIGLSRNARLLLSRLAEVYQYGERKGLRGDQLSFTLSVSPVRTTVVFASGHPPLETGDTNAILVLRSNGLIEEFTSIERTSNERRYVVTQAGVNAGRSSSFGKPDPSHTAYEFAGSDPSDGRSEELVAHAREKSHGKHAE